VLSLSKQERLNLCDSDFFDKLRANGEILNLMAVTQSVGTMKGVLSKIIRMQEAADKIIEIICRPTSLNLVGF